MAILKIKDADGNFISVPTITGMPKEIYVGVNEPTNESTWIWVDTSEHYVIKFTVYQEKLTPSYVEYTANVGMTWGEWVASEYNTDGYEINNYNEINKTNSNGTTTALKYETSTGAYVRPDEVIDSTASYYGLNMR